MMAEQIQMETRKVQMTEKTISKESNSAREKISLMEQTILKETSLYQHQMMGRLIDGSALGNMLGGSDGTLDGILDGDEVGSFVGLGV